jgi:DNA-binding HxlR family transcriptional regulator
LGRHSRHMDVLLDLRSVAGTRRAGALDQLIEEKPPDNQKGDPPSSAGASSVGDALKSLSIQFNDPCLKSSTRVLILLSLALNGKLAFADLLRLTGTGKGSLSNHLEKLEASGFIKTKDVMTFSGTRTVAEITEKGLQSYNAFLESMKKLGK